MLKLKYLFENFELARRCVALYEGDWDSVDEMLQYFRISSNAIYPFRLKTEKNKICFLRLSPMEEKKLSDVETEICLIGWLIEKGFSAMRPMPMKDGRLVGQISTEWGTYNVSCFEKVQGKSLEEMEGTLQIVKGYGKTLGELHALMKKYPNAEKRRNHKELLREIEERMLEYNASKTVKKEYAAVCKELEQMPLSISEYGIIHYDFEPDNVFYDEKEGIFSVIDFDDAICCWYALDVVRALDSLDEVIVYDDMEEAKRYFLEGYRSATTFTETQVQSMPTMRRLVRLQEYTTLLYVLSEKVKNMPDWMSNLSKKLKCKLEQLEEAMDKGMTGLITFAKLSNENFNANSLDGFIRHQEIKECWRKVNNSLVLVPNEYVEDWNLEKCRDVAQTIVKGIAESGFAYGAFLENEVIGYIYVSKRFFGRDNQYIELQLFHITESLRRKGIGKELFRLASAEAKMMGAKKLYISAHSSKESQEAYCRLGCVEAVEINRDIAENEPFDIQMEYLL